MIKVLGTKRILILIGLLGLNILLASTLYLYLFPEETRKEREVRAMRGQISNLRTDIDRLQIEFEQLEDQRASFEVLKEKGFLSDQGRRQAEKNLEAIQEKAEVISAIASIQSATIEENPEAEKADHVILSSPVTIKIKAVDDIDVFKYLYLLDEFFPGHITVMNMVIERKANITSTILRSIASGGNPELVEAQINMIWRTMVPKDEIDMQILQQEGNK